MSVWPPLEATDLPDTRAKGAPYHIGLMITQDRAIAVASALYADEIADGTDCRAEIGRIGDACRHCAERNTAWIRRVREVRNAMVAAFK
jgi:hypothetical protein